MIQNGIIIIKLVALRDVPEMHWNDNSLMQSFVTEVCYVMGINIHF